MTRTDRHRGSAAAGPPRPSSASLPHSAKRLQSCFTPAFGVREGREVQATSAGTERKRWARATSQGTVLASGAVPKPRNFFISPLACCFDVCYFLKHPRVARPASWQIGLAPIGVADAAAVHRIFPYNLISDALRMAAHASLLPICAFLLRPRLSRLALGRSSL